MAGTEADFGTVKVDAEILRAKGEEAFVKLQTYQGGLEQIHSLIQDSGRFWGGKAGDLYRLSMQNQITNAMEILQEFSEYPKDLLGYAGIYSETISRTEALAESIDTLQLF